MLWKKHHPQRLQAKSKDPIRKDKKVEVSAGRRWHQKLLGKEYGFRMKEKWYGMEVRS